MKNDYKTSKPLATNAYYSRLNNGHVKRHKNNAESAWTVFYQQEVLSLKTSK